MRPHHYGALIQRWRAVARSAGVRLQRFAQAGDDALYFLKTPALAATGGIYISAAIHGDEPASSEALITWAEKHARRLAHWPLLLFPCLNPWGLRNNIRLDATGLDLNRAFHSDDHPVIAALKRVAAPHRFDLAVMLHEDYDAQGFYLYEIKRALPFWGEDLLAVAGRHIAIDPRKKIDGHVAASGLIRRRFNRARFDQIGFPEAIWLHEQHARRALTIETPSEFALEQRVRAHVAVVEECVRRAAPRSARTAARA
ncbi:MAG: M14 family metallocarboxypeptidase [Chthoniobacteraceae bacterium]